MRLPRFISKSIPGFEVTDLKEWIPKKFVEIYLKNKCEEARLCSKCKNPLEKAKVSEHKVRIRTMDVFGFKAFYIYKRQKHHCLNCKKIRSEHLDFVSPETPHLSREYSWWLGRLCEISAVSRAAEFSGNNQMTMWRTDFKRMRRMFQNYKIPAVRRISVDEVYARRSKYKYKSRDNDFFTVVSDLETRKVIWVSESRSKEALDEFYYIIGKEACKKIEVVAMDQYDGYKKSTEQMCPNATVVWDRFHIMKNMNEAINKDRKWLHKYIHKGEKTNGSYKRLFLKRADRRTHFEKRHIKQVQKDNETFISLELIKEGMHELYESKNEVEAKEKFKQMRDWINQEKCLHYLKSWWESLNKNWDTFKNYFKYPCSSALSEGQNNVIKTIKKRGYGYRNMAYFKLKILQVCGYLNSRYIGMEF